MRSRPRLRRTLDDRCLDLDLDLDRDLDRDLARDLATALGRLRYGR